jgi:glycosyltransferase involved in cell wall biosynthesis
MAKNFVTRSIVVVIPFRDEPHLTLRLLEHIDRLDPCHHVVLVDNESTQDTLDKVTEATDKMNRWDSGPRVHLIHEPGQGIYRLWNVGLQKALELEVFPYVAFLNNDIRLRQFSLATMADTLNHHLEAGIVYPDYDVSVDSGSSWKGSVRATVGTKQHGGMCGHAFMLRSDLIDKGLPFIDENLKWWYGDDFIEMQVRSLGYDVLRLVGLPCDHINEATANNGTNDWTHEAKRRDSEYWYSTYG